MRFILRDTLVVHDLLYIEGGIPPPDAHYHGYYVTGLVVVYSNVNYTRPQDRGVRLGIFAHEIAHAHQHALTNADGSGNFFAWEHTPEGVAYREAQGKDWEEFGKVRHDSDPSYEVLYENAAEVCAYYWGFNRWGGKSHLGKLEITAPHRFKWAQEWLTKR